MTYTVISLTGLPGSGKDTVADHLVEQHGFTKIAFADALYQEVAEGFGVSVEFLKNREGKESPSLRLSLELCRESAFVAAVLPNLMVDCRTRLDHMIEPRSPRWVLQQWGTEYRRGQVQSYWVDKVQRRVSAMPAGAKVVISDVRFRDEALLCYDLRESFIGTVPVYAPGGLWQIVREGCQASGYASDREIPRALISEILVNHGTLDDLYGNATAAMAADLYGSGVFRRPTKCEA